MGFRDIFRYSRSTATSSHAFISFRRQDTRYCKLSSSVYVPTLSVPVIPTAQILQQYLGSKGFKCIVSI
ncbi:hypothetical protein L596_007279 [Steinernema carpocapsae]|uniref:Uncharacterized protein n=1 Tax=Steinernema carpocapsae TaxID=34508 RepID=A0A4U5P8S4_STECR|nr:hypothetical protein L596_007279 [Steinernema carpocapsae]